MELNEPLLVPVRAAVLGESWSLVLSAELNLKQLPKALVVKLIQNLLEEKKNYKNIQRNVS